MTIQNWIDYHLGGFAIGNIVNSNYVQNYMIVKYSDWHIADNLNMPTYGLWTSYVARNVNRLSAFYNKLYERKDFNFTETYRQEKSGNSKTNINGDTTFTPSITNTHNMGQWEEEVETTLYNVAVNSYTEKESGKNKSKTTQPITVNTDVTSGTQKEVKADTNITNYTSTVSGFNGKTQSEYLIDSYAEFDLNPIDSFIDRFVRGYFVIG